MSRIVRHRLRYESVDYMAPVCDGPAAVGLVRISRFGVDGGLSVNRVGITGVERWMVCCRISARDLGLSWHQAQLRGGSGRLDSASADIHLLGGHNVTCQPPNNKGCIDAERS